MRNDLLKRRSHFSSWRPYSNPNRLVRVGMSETEVEAITGPPTDKDFYTGTRKGNYMAITGWYYVKTGSEATLLEFYRDRLFRIVSMP